MNKFFVCNKENLAYSQDICFHSETWRDFRKVVLKFLLSLIILCGTLRILCVTLRLNFQPGVSY
jgi:hypothetical protein